MAISGLVLTLTDNDALRARTLQLLAEMPELALGEPTGLRQPAVADTPHRWTDRELFERLQAMPGVHYAEVAYVWFDDEVAPAMTFDGAHTPDATTVAERDGAGAAAIAATAP